MRAVLFAVLVTTPALMGFCEGVTTDPHDGGYLAGVCGLKSGAYASRVRDLENTRDSLYSQGDRLEERLRRSKSTGQALDRSISSQKVKLAEMEREIGKLIAEVNRRAAEHSKSQAELDRLKAEINQLQTELVSLYKPNADLVTAQRHIDDGIADARSQTPDEGSVRTAADALKARILRAKKALQN